MVFYILTMSWTTVFFSLPSFHRFPDRTKSLKLLSILQSYLIFAFVLILLFHARTFGNRVECNPRAVMVIFRPFSAVKASRILEIIIVLVVALYTSMTAIDYLPPRLKRFKQWFGRHRRLSQDDLEATRPIENDSTQISNAIIRDINIVSRHVSRPVSLPCTIVDNTWMIDVLLESPIYDLNISGELCMKLVVILILWAVTVMNTELLILWNHLKQDPSAQTPWQFGQVCMRALLDPSLTSKFQVLPMFLLIQPFLSLVSTFTKYKLSPRQNLRYQI